MPGFVPSRRELLLLYAYWAEEKLDLEFFRWCNHQVISCDLRSEAFAALRMGRIEEALGDDPALEATIQDVETKYSANIKPLVWKVFSGKATEEEKRLEAMDHARSLGIDSTQGAETSS